MQNFRNGLSFQLCNTIISDTDEYLLSITFLHFAFRNNDTNEFCSWFISRLEATKKEMLLIEQNGMKVWSQLLALLDLEEKDRTATACVNHQ